MRIWENFKAIADFNEIKNKRECWSKCNECSKKWAETNTEHVHMYSPKGQVKYLCDICKNKMI
jgi:hypothetical protein